MEIGEGVSLEDVRAATGASFQVYTIKNQKKRKKSVMSALCHERLTWPIDASRGGIAGWKAGWKVGMLVSRRHSRGSASGSRVTKV